MRLPSTEYNFARGIDLPWLLRFVAVCERGRIGKAAKGEFTMACAISKYLLRPPLSA